MILHDDPLCTLYLGDCVEVMRELPAESVDAVVTDPPYWLSFMGKAWDGSQREDEDAGFGYYLSGLVDGEGHFRVQAQARGTYSCAFSIHMRLDDRAILVRAQRFLGVGSVTEEHDEGHSPMARLNVQAKADCLRVVEVLTRYPLRAKKLRDFLPWAESVLEWNGMKRGHRWSGKGDWSRLAALKTRIESAREYRDPPWSGNSYQDWTREWAEEALRVLKPGGHLLSFSGTRTYHRMTSGLEDAGWEIRDCLVWAYASGFPKSLDVSKAIDKAREGRHEEVLPITRAIRLALASSGLTRRDLNLACGLGDNDAGSAQSWVTESADGAHKPRVPTVEQWAILRGMLGLQELDAEVWRLNGRKGTPGENWDKREVIGERARKGKPPQPMWDEDAGQAWKDTAPATPEAEKWDGWGTALKPAWEPIVMARKPLRGTVAANVLAHGTGALNIDATRIGTADGQGGGATSSESGWFGDKPYEKGSGFVASQQGRWPSNVLLTSAIFDGDTPGVVGGGEAGVAGVAVRRNIGISGKSMFAMGDPGQNMDVGYGDSGTYSRFFIVPKSSRSDREPLTRDEAYRLHRDSGACDKLGACQRPDPSPDDPTDSTSPARAISEDSTTADSPSDTSPPGKMPTAPSRMATSSTTSTATSRTTDSTTSSSLIRSPTSDSTPAVSSATGNGGSPAESADNGSLWGPPTGTSPEKDGRSTGDADPATSARWSSRNSCGDCGKPLPRVSTHPTQKPTDLMRHLVRLVTPPGGTVLDPFLGSGTTAIAANDEGFRCIGIEKEREYLDITLARMTHQPLGMQL